MGRRFAPLSTGFVSLSFVVADNSRSWISQHDPDGSTWLYDLEFLSSPWHCIFGNGCRGVFPEDATDLGHGCCSHGAHFADSEDVKSTRKAIQRLTAKQWERRSQTRRLGGPLVTDDGVTTTRVIQGACCFHNSAEFPGGHGCALHLAALEAGERPLDWKPDVCWQLPLRLEFHQDENGREVHTLRRWDRFDWGEGGLDFHWWCVDANSEAYSGATRVLDYLKEEICEMIGPERYDWLRVHVNRRDVAASPVHLNRARS